MELRPVAGSHFRLHGNPGDYAWGNAELDRIVTQLLNQLDSSGPPPLGQALIQRLPTVTITQASVGQLVQGTGMDRTGTGDKG